MEFQSLFDSPRERPKDDDALYEELSARFDVCNTGIFDRTGNYRIGRKYDSGPSNYVLSDLSRFDTVLRFSEDEFSVASKHLDLVSSVFRIQASGQFPSRSVLDEQREVIAYQDDLVREINESPRVDKPGQPVVSQAVSNPLTAFADNIPHRSGAVMMTIGIPQEFTTPDISGNYYNHMNTMRLQASRMASKGSGFPGARQTDVYKTARYALCKRITKEIQRGTYSQVVIVNNGYGVTNKGFPQVDCAAYYTSALFKNKVAIKIEKDPDVDLPDEIEFDDIDSNMVVLVCFPKDFKLFSNKGCDVYYLVQELPSLGYLKTHVVQANYDAACKYLKANYFKMLDGGGYVLYTSATGLRRCSYLEHAIFDDPANCLREIYSSFPSSKILVIPLSSIIGGMKTASITPLTNSIFIYKVMSKILRSGVNIREGKVLRQTVSLSDFLYAPPGEYRTLTRSQTALLCGKSVGPGDHVVEVVNGQVNSDSRLLDLEFDTHFLPHRRKIAALKFQLVDLSQFPISSGNYVVSSLGYVSPVAHVWGDKLGLPGFLEPGKTPPEVSQATTIVSLDATYVGRLGFNVNLGQVVITPFANPIKVLYSGDADYGICNMLWDGSVKSQAEGENEECDSSLYTVHYESDGALIANRILLPYSNSRNVDYMHTHVLWLKGMVLETQPLTYSPVRKVARVVVSSNSRLVICNVSPKIFFRQFPGHVPMDVQLYDKVLLELMDSKVDIDFHPTRIRKAAAVSISRSRERQLFRDMEIKL